LKQNLDSKFTPQNKVALGDAQSRIALTAPVEMENEVIGPVKVSLATPFSVIDVETGKINL